MSAVRRLLSLSACISLNNIPAHCSCYTQTAKTHMTSVVCLITHTHTSGWGSIPFYWLWSPDQFESNQSKSKAWASVEMCNQMLGAENMLQVFVAGFTTGPHTVTKTSILSFQDSSEQRQRLHLHQKQNHPAVSGAHLHRPEGQWGSNMFGVWSWRRSWTEVTLIMFWPSATV